MSSTAQKQQIRMGELASFKTGKLDSNASIEGGKYPFFTCSRETFRTNTYSFDDEVVLLAGNNAAGIYPLKYFKGKFDAYQRTYVIRPLNSELLDTRFLYYSLFPQLEHLKDISTGAATKFLTMGLLENLKLTLPDLPTQRRIAGILSAYDDLIENNLRRIRILEEMAQSLYREWFVHFRFPGHESVPLVESPLGPIPQGWEVKTIGDVAIVHRGRSYRSKELLEEGGIPFVNLKCIQRDGGFRRDGLKHYNGSYKEEQKVEPGDIVMAVTDMTQERRIVARAARVPTLERDFGVISMDLVKIEVRNPNFSDFIYSFFRCSDFADHVKQHANGANVLHLSPDRIRDHRFLMPSNKLCRHYEEIAQLQFSEIENLHQRSDLLRQTRDLLIPKFFL